MPAPKDTLKDRLARYRQIMIGRRSGADNSHSDAASNADCRSNLPGGKRL
jgi:hypothetical protein